MLMLIILSVLAAGAAGWFSNRRSLEAVSVTGATDGRVSSAAGGFRAGSYPFPDGSYAAPDGSYATPNGSDPSYRTPYGTPQRGFGSRGDGGPIGAGGAGMTAARAQASSWVNRLGSGITAMEGRGDTANHAAQQAVSQAAERHVTAARQLAGAVSVRQAERAGRTAIEGLEALRSARVALGFDPGPAMARDRVDSLRA